MQLLAEVPTVVIATRNRAARLMDTIERLRQLPERPPIIVVDNASQDKTCQVILQRFPEVQLIAARENLGAAARNLGVEASDTPDSLCRSARSRRARLGAATM